MLLDPEVYISEATTEEFLHLMLIQAYLANADNLSTLQVKQSVKFAKEMTPLILTELNKKNDF